MFLGLQLGDPLTLWVASLASTRGRQPRQRASVTGPPPLHDVAGIQALTAQQRALLTLGRSFIGRQDLQLVLGGERPPLRPLGHLRIGTLRTIAIHPTRIIDPYRGGQCGHLACHLGETLHPRPRVTNYQGASASPKVGREGGQWHTEDVRNRDSEQEHRYRPCPDT